MSMPANLSLRRRNEERLFAAQSHVAAQRNVANFVNFEHRTDNKINSRLIREQMQREDAAARENVLNRRCKLAALLEEEKNMYEREVEASFESPEQVKERLFAKARQLKQQREEERLKLVEELRAKQFRQNSDVLRANASRLSTMRLAEVRDQQLEEKRQTMMMTRQRDLEDDERRLALDRSNVDREKVLAEAQRRLKAELAGALTEQARIRSEVNQAELVVDHQLDEEMLELDRRAAEAQRQAEYSRRQAAREEYIRVSKFNELDRNKKSWELEKELREDREMLEMALKREAEEEAIERAALIERRKAAGNFKETLEKQMAIEEENKAWMDKFYEEESEKEWRRREAVWKAEAEARAALAKGTIEDRDNQVRLRAIQRERELEEDARLMAEHERVSQELAAQDAKKLAERKMYLEQQKQYALEQLRSNERARAQQKQEEYLEWRLQQKTEREYAEKVNQLLAQENAAASHSLSGTSYGQTRRDKTQIFF